MILQCDGDGGILAELWGRRLKDNMGGDDVWAHFDDGDS